MFASGGDLSLPPAPLSAFDSSQRNKSPGCGAPPDPRARKTLLCPRHPPLRRSYAAANMSAKVRPRRGRRAGRACSLAPDCCARNPGRRAPERSSPCGTNRRPAAIGEREAQIPTYSILCQPAPHHSSCNSRDQLGQFDRRVRSLASLHPRRDGDRFRMVLKPGQKRGLFLTRQPLLIEPGVIRAHVGIDQ